MRPAREILAENLNRLLDQRPVKLPRPEAAALMGIGDKTLGNMKSGGNPQLDNIDAVARHFKLEAWQLLKPADTVENTLRELQAMVTPRSRAAIDAISRAAEDGRLTEDDVLLLHNIATRFLGRDA